MDLTIEAEKSIDKFLMNCENNCEEDIYNHFEKWENEFMNPDSPWLEFREEEMSLIQDLWNYAWRKKFNLTEITKVALDDRNILCFQFDYDEWVAVNQHKWATEEQRRLIEEHPEFEGWDDDDLCDSEEEDEDEV